MHYFRTTPASFRTNWWQIASENQQANGQYGSKAREKCRNSWNHCGAKTLGNWRVTEEKLARAGVTTCGEIATVIPPIARAFWQFGNELLRLCRHR